MDLSNEPQNEKSEIERIFNTIKDSNQRSSAEGQLKDQKKAKQVLLYAVEQGDNAVVHFILQKDIKITYSRRDENPVVLAAKKNFINILELLLNKEKINEFDGTFYTPLTAACAEGNYMIILYLLKQGADINGLDGVSFILLFFLINYNIYFILTSS